MKHPKKYFVCVIFCLLAVLLPQETRPANTKTIMQMMTQASQMLCTGDYDKTIEKCNEILRIEPRCSGAYYIRGFAYKYKEEYDRAILDFTQTIRIDPKYAAAYYGRALSYAYKQMYDEAISDFTSAIAIDPKYTDAYFNRARVYYDMEEYGKAWDDVRKARALGLETDLMYKGFIRKLQEASGRFQ